MKPEEFADLVGLPLETVQSYRSLGLLDPEDDGLFDDVDIMRVRVVPVCRGTRSSELPASSVTRYVGSRSKSSA
jgi:DNA-binding transcriptional MerR regulator